MGWDLVKSWINDYRSDAFTLRKNTDDLLPQQAELDWNARRREFCRLPGIF